MLKEAEVVVYETDAHRQTALGPPPKQVLLRLISLKTQVQRRTGAIQVCAGRSFFVVFGHAAIYFAIEVLGGWHSVIGLVQAARSVSHSLDATS